MSSFYGNGSGGGSSSQNNWDLSDRIAKGVNGNEEIVEGAIIQGTVTGDNINIASDTASHAEGIKTQATAVGAHTEGYSTIASGATSHAQGNSTIANHRSQHVFGDYNIEDNSSNSAAQKGNYIEIVGNGVAGARSNARTLDWDGNESIAGSLTLGKGTADEITITAAQLKSLIALLNN